MVRQGDVLLREVAAPRESERVDGARGLQVPGERTGHTHVLEAEVHETRGGRLLMLAEPGVMTHEEHGDVVVPEGWWQPVLQREFVPESRPKYSVTSLTGVIG